MSLSLIFMPETLVLEEPDLCFFRASGLVRSECVVIGGARGPDTLDLTTLALQRVEDAEGALTLTEHAKYSTTLLQYGLDELPEEFLPGPETFRGPSFGRRPPLSPEAAAEVKRWYAALRGARRRRNEDRAFENAVAMSIDALTTPTKFKAILMYSAFEELCEILGGHATAKAVLKFSTEDRHRIERARRPVAHGGAKAKGSDPKPESMLLREASSSFREVLFRFLQAESERP